MSEHAKRLIVQFMAACCGRSERKDADAGLDEQHQGVKELPHNMMALTRVHALLDRMSQGGDAEKPSAKVSARKVPSVVTMEVAEDDGDDKALTRPTQMKDSLEVTSKLWTRTGTSWSGLAFDSRSTALKGDPAAPTLLSSKRSRQKKTSAFHNRTVQVQAYINWNQGWEKQWVAALWLAQIFV